LSAAPSYTSSPNACSAGGHNWSTNLRAACATWYSSSPKIKWALAPVADLKPAVAADFARVPSRSAAI